MPISAADIKIMASERMTDEDDGGGMQTANEIVDGEANNLFPDISRLDRTYGRVSLRKFFASVQTDTVDTYYGSHSVITDPPDDPNVGVLLFSTGSHTDERAAARNLIEAYVVRGPTAGMFLFENQLEGQRSILCWQRTTLPLPEVGEVYCLVEDEGQGGEFFQYVRITSVDFEDRQFSTADCSNEFTRRVVTLGIGNALRDTFHGTAISCRDNLTPAAIIRETQVADASRYYGAVRPAVNIEIGDLAIEAASIYGQLVPSTRGEAPLVDVQAGGTVMQDIVSGGETFEIAGPAHTSSIAVELQNRAYNYVQSCIPIPAVGSLSVDFRAMGKWYRLTDDGSGTLTGEGTGTINFETGSIIVTLGALPDVGSEVIFTWGTPVHYTDRAGSVDIDPPVVYHTLATPVEPGTFAVSWTQGGNAKAATAGLNGDVSGDCTGHVVHPTGELWLRFPIIPDDNTQLVFDYEEVTSELEIVTGLSPSGGIVNFTLAALPKPGTVSVDWQVLRSEKEHHPGLWMIANDQGTYDRKVFQYTDTGVEERKYTCGEDGLGDFFLGKGTINYANGDISLDVEETYTNMEWDGKDGVWDGVERSESLNGGTVTVRYTLNSATPAARQESIDMPALTIQLLLGVADVLIPGTLRFTMGETAYSDRAGQGLLYWDDGTVAGSVDYEARAATLQLYPSAIAITIDSLISTFGQWYDYNFFFRTPGSPLQPGGFLVNATALGGDLISEQADFSGIISSAEAEGEVEQDMGVVHIRYGELVLDDDLTSEQKSEPWYDPADVDGEGYIWLPTFVFPNTVRYNCVVYTYLPLDADILGLDPVRLPSDGRVPIIRPGEVIVVHQDETFPLTDPLTAGAVEQLPHTFIASCGLVDQESVIVDDALYVVDRKLGRITMADPLDLSAYTEPLVALYRIENMQLVSDVQIGGTITCVSPFSHAFDKAKSYISTALIHGDLQARIKNFFHQYTWTGVWSNERIGDSTIAKYNDVSFPLAVRNDAAIKERWLIKFATSTTFVVIGEVVGQIAEGDTSSDLNPINPLTGLPYFTMYSGGWGSGWSVGNCIRFNTEAAAEPVWVSRCVVTGEATHEADEFKIQVRGDAD